MQIRVNLLLLIFKWKYRDSVILTRYLSNRLNLLNLLVFEMVIRAPIRVILIVSNRVLLIRNLEAVLAPDNCVDSSKCAKNWSIESSDCKKYVMDIVKCSHGASLSSIVKPYPEVIDVKDISINLWWGCNRSLCCELPLVNVMRHRLCPQQLPSCWSWDKVSDKWEKLLRMINI